ncbi:ricin-type beta-trefoil lectin domain protein [Streptomyces sporangiiformans]|uniref:Ricin-type beta-trefoil lectin domain protein n=1 Tax=Streptomyces sporangiiformans TaxID=2315329 RepID=A0A505DLE1_9ACTN|nr:ricin-type beta-trefoil lectin domain protein [Streptomyces sporangiiformans]TPQ22748.1 ricin-type beta-trefoil lectin domain protein [Streptomyces sporangiiformans]
MHTPHPPRPTYPPRPGAAPGESDESLAALLRAQPEGELAQSIPLLFARHWQPTYDYSVICLASKAHVASMVTAAAFQQILDRLKRSESAVALRPQLLVTVRDTVRAWSAEDRISDVLPELRKPAGGRGMRATKSLTPENRKLAERSFQALPGLAQCVLWHTEVEAEHISVPAGLLGMDPDTASAALDQAREQFRQGCVRAHRELAPNKDCRYYNRLLDVPIRRGGALLPDVQQHLLECRFCRYAAEQLSHFEGELGVLLAESVLGWGARRYVDSRPGRGHAGARPGRSGGRRPRGGGRHRLLSSFPTGGRRAPQSGRNARAMFTGAGLVTAAGLVSVALLATLLVTTMWSQDDGATDPSTPGASGTNGPSAGPSAGAGPQAPPAGSSSPPPALPTLPGETRLRNFAADLCLDIKGGKAKSGAATKLVACSSAETQQWSYEEDGLLRSVANPKLCLDSHVDAGVVVLGGCASADAKRGDDVRYDLTVRGELLPRWHEGLAVAPSSKDPNADVVVKIRDRTDEQRWLTDGSTASPESLSIAGTGAPSTQSADDRPAEGADAGQPAGILRDDLATGSGAAPQSGVSVSVHESTETTV